MLRPGDRVNFDTLRRACDAGDLALVECTNRGGQYVAVLAAVGYDAVSQEFVLTPLARMFDGNPYDEVRPPGDTPTEEAMSHAGGD